MTGMPPGPGPGPGSGAGPGAGMAEHMAALRRYALVLTRNRDEAEDLVQECLARAISAAGTYRPGSDMRAWLFRILHNVHVSAMRRRRVREAFQAESGAGTGPDAHEDAAQHRRLEVRDVLAALALLPDEQREAVTLIAIDEVKYEEAARILGVPVGTLMSRLGRGRAALRELLNRRHPDERPGHPRLRLVKGGRRE